MTRDLLIGLIRHTYEEDGAYRPVLVDFFTAPQSEFDTLPEPDAHHHWEVLSK